MTDRKPPVPKGLRGRGRAFWKAVVADYTLDLAETELLTEVCRALDECEALHAVIEEQGRTVPGSRGQIVAHPALGELRSTRLMLGRLLAQLELPDEDGASLPTPVQARGRRAAQSRWAAQGCAPWHGVDRGPSDAEVADAAGIPARVRQVGYRAILRDAGQGLHVADLHAEHLHRIEASKAWCAERGLSYCMTVLDWRTPSPHEVAAGLTKGPADL